MPEIKAAYFRLAKRFHPDLFYRRVADELHRRIQNAFTRIAQSYETLRNAESREVYDFKLRKEIANLSKRAKNNSGRSQTPLQMMEEQAAENFEQGFNLIMEEEFEEAVPLSGSRRSSGRRKCPLPRLLRQGFVGQKGNLSVKPKPNFKPRSASNPTTLITV